MRCPTCDSRYCGAICSADRDDTAYVVGRGWVDLDRAWRLKQTGRTVDWPQSPVWDVVFSLGRRGWTPVRDYGVKVDG